MLSDIEDELRLEAEALRGLLGRERRARQHLLEINRLGAETSGEVTRGGVAEVLVAGASTIFECHWVMVAYVDADEMVRIIHSSEVPPDVLRGWSSVPLSTSVPITDVLRGDLSSCALVDKAAFAPWPALVAEAERAEIGSLFLEPIPGDDRPAAVVAMVWRNAHCLDELEGELLAEMVRAATPAFARAIKTEVDRDLATTLQRWLLPSHVPDVEGLEIATLYEAGRQAQDVGGDWYDIVRLDDHRSIIVVGDVVGHDARAAAEMGQVRHVLATHLLTTGDPAESLRLTDHYFHLRSTNTMATALVMLFDSSAATVELASAGHLPPVMAELGGRARFVQSGLGPPIGAGLGGYRSVAQPFPVQTLLVAFTDGVVELRGETIDDGIEDFCRAMNQAIEAAARATGQQVAVGAIIDMIGARVASPDRIDDAAAVVCRARRPLG